MATNEDSTAQIEKRVMTVGTASLVVLRSIWIVLSLVLYGIVQLVIFITTPLQWLVAFLYYLIGIPINFLSRFEPVLFYFGTACILGLLAGTSLFYGINLMFGIFRLDKVSSLETKSPRGRTAASYRAERAQKQAEQAWNFLKLREMPAISDTEFKADGKGWSPGGGLARYPLSPAIEKKGLLSTTIFEEEDSSDYTTI